MVHRRAFRAVSKGLERGSRLLASDYTKRIKRGSGASGESLKPVEESTMNQPIRRGGPDRRIRRTVNPAKNIPIVATGETAESIKSKKIGDEFHISSNTSKGDMILEVNRKLGRDPVQVSGNQMDIIEKEILKELDKVF